MSTSVAEPRADRLGMVRGTAPSPRPWPLWTSIAMVAAGVLVVALDTTSALVVVGVAFLCLGAYGLVCRRRPGPAPAG